MLLSLECESFEELALRSYAKKRGTKFSRLQPPTPDCPECHQYDRVGTKGDQGYFCNRCNRTFQAYDNSIIFDKKKDDLLYVQVITAILEGYGQTKVCEMTGVTEATYFRIRNKVFYALQCLLSDVTLSGIVQADCCFVRVSYKGLDLNEEDVDDESMFYDKTAFIPREDRKRGSPFKLAERNANSICILSLIDEYGKCRNIMCGTGLSSLKTFKMFVPEGLIQKTVPETEPFTLLKKSDRKSERKPGNPTLLVTDGEKSLESYANYIGVKYEPHVYRKDGVQRKLPEGAHDIQKVNALHSRLKKFLRARSVSSKYLPGFLLLFDALDMTGGSYELK